MGFSEKRKFLVVGMGRSGKAVALLLASKGFEVVVFDDDKLTLDAVLDSSVSEPLNRRIEIATEDSVVRRLIESDALVVSPGVPLEHPLVQKAKTDGIEVIGELEVAYHFASAPIMAVTGTNGKSTTVSMIGDIFRAAKRRHVVAGNIGTPFSTVVGKEQTLDIIVLEVSSFQLDTLSDF